MNAREVPAARRATNNETVPSAKKFTAPVQTVTPTLINIHLKLRERGWTEKRWRDGEGKMEWKGREGMREGDVYMLFSA